MHDVVVRTLTNVRHVSELKKNLISLGTLDDIECRYTTEGGVLKIFRGVMTAIKWKKVNTLHHLLRETVNGTTTVSSGESNFNLT